MQKRIVVFMLAMLWLCRIADAQNFYQFFDGADTTAIGIKVWKDTVPGNVWQIGPPQKSVFTKAQTLPNVMVTDTLLRYPVGMDASFYFSFKPQSGVSKIALHWKQKLHTETSVDGGTVEYSSDGGVSWTSIFSNPLISNFTGYQAANVGPIFNSLTAFHGTDTVWRDVWLDFDIAWLSAGDSLLFRYRFMSDPNQSMHDGWMIDNLMIHDITPLGVSDTKASHPFRIVPQPASHSITLLGESSKPLSVSIFSIQGQCVGSHHGVSLPFSISLASLRAGLYTLRVQYADASVAYLPLLLSSGVH